MNILFVTPEFVTESNFDGGLSNYLYRISLALKSFGHKPVVFVKSEENNTEIFYFNTIEVHRINVKIPNLLKKIIKLIFKNGENYFLTKIENFKVKKYIENYLQKNKVDIIQYASYTCPGYYRIKKIPCVIRISSIQKLWRENYGNKNPNKYELKYEKMELESFNKVDSVYSPSVLLAKYIENELKIKTEIIETPIFLDIDENDFDNLYYDKIKDKKYLLFFGTLGKLKGVDLIGEIIYDIFKNNSDIYFVFAGKEFGVLEQLYLQSKEYKDRIIYFNKMEHKYLYPIVKNAYAVVLPSRFDNFPNTCLEAMYFERVVIGTYGTSFEQIIKDGENGFLAQKENSRDLYSVIMKVLSLSPSHLKEIGKKAKESLQRLSPDLIVKRLISYYEKLIKEFKY